MVNIPTQSQENLNIHIVFNPTLPETKQTTSARQRVEDHKNIISASLPLELDLDTESQINNVLKSTGIDPVNLQLKSKHFDIAFNVHARGGRSEDFENKINESRFLNLQEKEDLIKSNIILKGLEETQKDLTKDLQLAFRRPEIVIQETAPQTTSPDFQPLQLRRTDGGLSPAFRIAEAGVKKIAGKLLGEAKTQVKNLAVKAVKEGIKKGGILLAKLGISAAGGPPGWIFAALDLARTALKKIGGFLASIPRLFTGEKDTKKALMALGAVMLAGGLALGNTTLALAGAGTMGVSAISSIGVAASGAQAAGFIGSILTGVVTVATPIFTPAVLIAVIAVPLFVIFALFIVNNSALVVPFGDFGLRSLAPPIGSGLVSSCEESTETGPEITNQLAARIKNGVVNLLPNTVWGRADGICITPTMIIMHWSAGPNDDPDGNNKTYNTLVSRNLSCQLATDTNDTWLMERFFELQVEFPACAGEWNTYSINNEMAGAYFTDTPPPPNLQELELAYDATCKVMEQYEIPWCQIYGHFEVPNSGGKIDPGQQFLYNEFIPEIRRRCPNDDRNACAGTTHP